MAQLNNAQLMAAFMAELNGAKTPEGAFDPIKVAAVQAKYAQLSKPKISFEAEKETAKDGTTSVRFKVSGLKKGPPLKMSAEELNILTGEDFKKGWSEWYVEYSKATAPTA